MRLSSYPKQMVENERLESLSSTAKPKDEAREGLNCPFGTVPIRRITKADLLSARTYGQNYFSQANVLNTLDRPGVHVSIYRFIQIIRWNILICRQKIRAWWSLRILKVAAARISFDAKKKYIGGRVNVSIGGPAANSHQYSLGQIKIINKWTWLHSSHVDGKSVILIQFITHRVIRAFTYTYAPSKTISFHCQHFSSSFWRCMQLSTGTTELDSSSTSRQAKITT